MQLIAARIDDASVDDVKHIASVLASRSMVVPLDFIEGGVVPVILAA